jgi:endonuclease/exonuclease/phosphatase family metal-dependent hydrolase
MACLFVSRLIRYDNGLHLKEQDMKFSRILITLFTICLVTACTAQEPSARIRIATFNIAMGLENEGELHLKLQEGHDPAIGRIAEVLQRVRPDIVLINELDYTEGSEDLFRTNYLEQSQSGQQPIDYPYAYSTTVNTGVRSGLDFNNNGSTEDPEDAWGFGRFPGQYGMLVLSRFPIDRGAARTFQNFLWKDMPDALRPENPDGTEWYPDETWNQMRLSSKSHWDLPIDLGNGMIHFLVTHPTPTVFDGPEDRNGRRNHDENRMWVDYISPENSDYLVDDNGQAGGLSNGEAFFIAGDLNADPVDGGWLVDSMGQLLNHPGINNSCIPSSEGSRKASETQGGINAQQKGDPAADTGDFNDEYAGNLRIDYVLPSAGLNVIDCGVYWPVEGDEDHHLANASDHHLVWVDFSFD